MKTIHTGRAIGVAVIVALGVMAGRSEAADFYAQIGVGYAPAKTPWSTQMGDREYDWKGSNPIAYLEAGIAFDNGVSLSWSHTSNWLTGWPLNKDHETGLDAVKLAYTWRKGL
jgi:hypothetical protein